jgi:uncharacterized protein YcbK (DUF882 family)
MLKHIDMRLYPCRCCGLSVTSPEFATILRGLDEALEEKGWCVRVNDGTRCPLHNAKVGGHPKSRHMSGQAVDLHPVFPEDLTPLQLKDFINSRMGIKGVYQGGLGLYSWGVHLDIGKTSRWNG